METYQDFIKSEYPIEVPCLSAFIGALNDADMGLVLHSLCCLQANRGNFDPFEAEKTIEYLQDKTGLSKKKIERAIKKLKKRGIIEAISG